jgi:hypothetical protein
MGAFGIVREMTRGRKVLTLVVAIVAASILSVWPFAAPRISIPWEEEAPLPAFRDEGIPDVVCTLVGYRTVGFPFKANLYDYCRQDPTGKRWIVVSNWLILMAVFYGLYKVTERISANKKGA